MKHQISKILTGPNNKKTCTRTQIWNKVKLAEYFWVEFLNEGVVKIFLFSLYETNN
jgi:hypothetical protein